MSIYEVAVEKFNKKINNDYFINKLKESIQELPPECKITKIDLENNYFDEKYGRTVKELYAKEDISRFFSNYVPKKSIFSELVKHVNRVTIYKYYNKLNPDEIILGGNLDIFISQDISLELTEIIKK